MDLISLYYFSELAKDLHMTRTANRLFISQQTLSNHIQRLEDYYGTKLFHRKPALPLPDYRRGVCTELCPCGQQGAGEFEGYPV